MTESRRHRYQIGFSPETESVLKYLSKTQKKSIARITQELVEKALEAEDDAYLCKLVEENERLSDGKTVSMEEFWAKNELKVEEDE